VREDGPVPSPRRRGAPVVREVDDAECWRLLESAPLGRVGLTDGALPVIMPVHFTLWHGEVAFASLPDVKIRSAERGDVLVLQVDHYEPATDEGWSVNAVGPARVVRDRAEVDALHARRFTPWAGDARVRYVAIRPTVLRGRRLGHDAPGSSAPTG
jgi:nitroimidazol reductase NimA-like FMN-containing flavoprotein (pyridoxamine 5'-phosphate oxidase superfamily)